MEWKHYSMLSFVRSNRTGVRGDHPKLTFEGISVLENKGFVEVNPSTKTVFVTPSGVKELSRLNDA